MALGAAFVDDNGNGRYEPQLDRPDLLGDKTLWTVMNDETPIEQRFPRGGLPIGLEVHFTGWAYQAGSAPLADALFFRYLLVNPGSDTLKSVYFSLFVDGDIGDPTDDLLGSDTSAWFGYFYNREEDLEYARQNLPTPALGVLILQGAVVPSPGDTAYRWHGPLRGVE